MNVLMLVNKMSIGGTENYVLNLARALRPLGIHVGVAAHDGPMTATFRKHGIRVHLFPNTAKKSKLASMLAKIVRSQAYRLIHAHDTPSYELADTLSRTTGVPLVLSMHGRYHGVPALRRAARRARRVIAITPRLQAWARALHIPSAKVVHIPAGVDTARFIPQSRASSRRKLGLSPHGELVVYASRFGRDKYPIARKVVKAGSIIAQGRKRSLSILAGPGKYRRHLAKQAAAANRKIGRRAIIVKPAMGQIQYLYGAADVTVGTGTVAIEAMACGKPVIAAGVKGYYGVITPRNLKSARYNQFGDHGGRRSVSTARIARDIRKVLDNRRWAGRLGRMGRRIAVSRYALSSAARRIGALYAQVLGGR